MNLADLTVGTVRERLFETGLSHAESLSKARQFARAAEALRRGARVARGLDATLRRVGLVGRRHVDLDQGAGGANEDR